MVSPSDAICAFVPPFLKYLREGVAKVDLTPARFQVLQVLGADKAMTMVELADQLSVTKRNITTIVDALEKDGLVIRSPHPTDRRSKLVKLTLAGGKLRSDAIKVQRDHLRKLMSILEPEEGDALARALSRLTQVMNNPIEK